MSNTYKTTVRDKALIKSISDLTEDGRAFGINQEDVIFAMIYFAADSPGFEEVFFPDFCEEGSRLIEAYGSSE